MVGIMRHGSLLLEQDPRQILQNFNSTSLETVVLELCKKDGIDNDQVGGCVGGDKAKITYDVESPDDTKCKLKLKIAKFLIQINLSKNSTHFHLYLVIPPFNDEQRNEEVLNSVNRIKSLVQKNVVVLLRNLM